MQLNVMLIIIVAVGFCISLIGHFWLGDYYKKTKFKVLLSVITTVTSVLFSTAVIIQVLNFNHQNVNEEIDKYENLSKYFLDDNVQMFLEHPDMNYYYEELIGIKMIDENTVRNIEKERQFSILIFSRMAKTAMYINTTQDQTLVGPLSIWFKRAIDTYMKSPTLQHYWTTLYKPTLSGPASRLYMKTNYNL